MGWVTCIANTAWDWQFSGLLNNVHTSRDGDFSQADNWHINRTDVLDKMIKHGMIIAILRMILLQMEERTSAIGADWARRLEDDDSGNEGEKAGTGLLV